MDHPLKIDDNQKLAELARVISSERFRRSEKQRQILEYLVKAEIAGKKPTENSIATDVYRIKTDDDQSFVRDRVGALRKSLEQYYTGEGKTNPVRIELQPGSYRPVFRPWPAPRGELRLKAGAARPGSKDLIWVMAAAALVSSAAWFIYNRPCKPQVSITDPQPGARVRHRQLISVRRKHEQGFCRCRDYLVVEPADLSQLWVQGELPEGTEAYLTATFGNADTPAGTRFTVFVLTAKSEFGPGPVTQVAIAGARMSAAIEVSLEKP